MRKRKAVVSTAFLILLFMASVLLLRQSAPGQQQDAPLAEGPGAELVKVKCSLCHELGHITRIRQTRDEWEETARTMIRRGAPITEEEATVIVEYLVKFYGKDGER